MALVKHWRATFDDGNGTQWTEVLRADGSTEARHRALQISVSPKVIVDHGPEVKLVALEEYRPILGPYRYGVPPQAKGAPDPEAETPCGICGRNVDVLVYFGTVVDGAWSDQAGEPTWVHISPCHRAHVITDPE